MWYSNFESLLSKARQSNLINSDFALKTILDEMNTFRGCCGMLQSFDWISIPLVYTQVVTVAVYGFFVSCLFGRQYLIPQNDSQNITLNVPVPNYEYEVGFISEPVIPHIGSAQRSQSEGRENERTLK